MTAIWQESPDGKWTLLTPAGFPDEKTLHDLVAAAPDLLPLSGSPRLIVLGREILLGSGYADLLAVEPDGRPVIIETKLRYNAESRRAVVAQVLAYAAALHAISAEQFEREVLARHLGGRSLIEVVRESVQEESLGAPDFAETLGTTLRDGTFRLVLDQAPDDLVRLVGYLETVTSGLSVDLVTVAAYEIGGRRVIAPNASNRNAANARRPSRLRPAGQDALASVTSCPVSIRSAPSSQPFRAIVDRGWNGSSLGRSGSPTRGSRRCPRTSASAARFSCFPGCCPNVSGSSRCGDGRTTPRSFRCGALCSNVEHPQVLSVSSR